MLLAFSVAPSGQPAAGAVSVDGSVHDAVAEAVKIVRESGLPNQTDSMFTNMRRLGHGKNLSTTAGF